MTVLTRHSRLVALIVATAFFMQMLDSAIITTSLPQMAESFGVRPLTLSIGITIYLLTMAVLVPISGWLADRYGTRNIFMLAILIFTTASLACGLAQSLPQFVVARAVQGLGSALMTPVGRIVVLRHAQKSELLHATALISWPALIAPVIGPVLGGLITTHASWHWNFFINIPLGVIGLFLVAHFVPNQREAERRKLDMRGFLLTSAGLTCLLCGLESFVHGQSGLLTTALLAAGLVISVLAVRHLQRTKHPLLLLSAFRVQTFALSTLSAGTYFRIAISAMPFLLPLLFQIGFGMSPLDAGALIFAYFLGNLGMKSVTTPMLRRFGFRPVLFVNGILAALSIAACAALAPDTPYALTVIALLIAGLTRSMQFTALNSLAFADVSVAQRSSAATLSSMLQQVSMLLGVAFATAALNLSQYTHGNSGLVLADFRMAFLAVALLALVASWQFLKLPHDAGAEVSGHGATRMQ